MGSGDIVTCDSINYMVLKQEGELLFCLDYCFNTTWLSIDECQKIGSSDAIFKVMYEISRGGNDYGRPKI